MHNNILTWESGHFPSKNPAGGGWEYNAVKFDTLMLENNLDHIM